jgi:hypothetical protein
MSIRYNKRPQDGPSVHEIHQHIPLQDLPKFTQIWIFGLKINHLATLIFGRQENKLSFRRNSVATTQSYILWPQIGL